MTIKRTANQPITFSGQMAAYDKGNKEQSRIIIGNSTVPKQFTNDIIEYVLANPGNPIIYTNDANVVMEEHCVLQDIGKNWSTISPKVGSQIYVSTYTSNGIVIAGDGSIGNIYRSTDFGLTWSTGISVTGSSTIFALTYAGNGIVIAGDGNNGNIYRSTDFGLTWSTAIPVGSRIFTLTYAGNGIIIAGDFDNGNIYRSVPTRVCH